MIVANKDHRPLKLAKLGHYHWPLPEPIQKVSKLVLQVN